MVNYKHDEVGVEAELSGSVQHISKGDLLALIRRVEDAVFRGTAQMRDYETFVCCQEELMRREVLDFERE